MLKIGLHLKAGSTTDPLVNYLLRPLTLMKMESCAAERVRLQHFSVHILLTYLQSAVCLVVKYSPLTFYIENPTKTTNFHAF